jgi:hypothetical protein
MLMCRIYLNLGTMEYRDHLYFIPLKNITIHGISKPLPTFYIQNPDWLLQLGR